MKIKNTSQYFPKLISEIIVSVNNNYNDNYDAWRFGLEPQERGQAVIKRIIKSRLHRRGYHNTSNFYQIAKIVEDAFWINDFAYLYDLLEDQGSKNLLIKIVTYRLLGYKKVKLPLSTPKYWHDTKLIESHQSKSDVIAIDFMNFKLPLTDLKFLNIPIKLYYLALGINVDFIIKQYEFHRQDIHIEAKPGEAVIDGGGCFGDTALYFANKIGKSGRVHVFEFIPDNIEILNKNISLNTELAPFIQLSKHPLWSTSGTEVFYLANGPGSTVSFTPFEGYTGKTATITIDDYVSNNNLEKVDFIKMDIEGAEKEALKGAVKTLMKFKPKLAIALYHSTSDFETIPRFLHDLNLGYKMYLSHATIFSEETMLFAKV